MNRTTRHVGTLALLAGLAACGGSDAPDADAEPGMEGMQGMDVGGSDAAMEQMRAHLARMGGMRADSLSMQLPVHRQMVGNSLAQMNADMRSMNMPADAAWTALVDSVRADVVALPELNPAELSAAIPAHLARVTRLLESHRTMMSRMGM
jgi:hypothetical protein